MGATSRGAVTSLLFRSRTRTRAVTASCPGFTLSEFHDVTGTREQVSRMPSFMWLQAEEVARGSYDAVMAGVPVYIPGRVNRSIASLSRLLPRRAVLSLMKRSAGNFRRV